MLGLEWGGLYVHVQMCSIVELYTYSCLLLLCIVNTDYMGQVELNLIDLFRIHSVS